MKLPTISGSLALIAAAMITTLFFSPAPGFSQNVKQNDGKITKQTEEKMMKQAEENIEKYRKGDVYVQFRSGDGKPLSNARIEVKQISHDFLFGCIIFDLVMGENTYKHELFKSRFKNIFNLAVFPFYWSWYEQEQGFTKWEDLLETIEWCRLNGITTKGHPLVWATPGGIPMFFADTEYTVEETEELLKNRVINITSGFRDKIELWDVVNEPVNVKTWRHIIQNPNDKKHWGVTDTISLIADYVEDALQWAHKGNPDATLMINEYRTLADKDVRQRYDDLIAELTRRKVPLKGIGIQAHEPLKEWFSPVEVWKTFDQYQRFGYPIHITEFHPQSSGAPITGGWRTGSWTPEAQVEFTEQFVKLCFGHPAVVSINWWGLSDLNIWQPGGGLIDEEYKPKPVYVMLDSLINQTWKTKTSLQTDSQGSVSFRGFYGNYEITLTSPDGLRHVFNVHVDKEEENNWIYTVD